MIVVDASSLINFFLAPRGMGAKWMSGEDIHAPHLVDAEVLQTMRRLNSRGDLDRVQSDAWLEIYSALALERHAHRPLFRRVWQLRHNFSAYDGLYVALAEALDCPLVTNDQALATAAAQFTAVRLA